MARIRNLLSGLAGATLAGSTTIAAAAEAPAAVASIKPIHSLLAGVMEGVAEPSLLVPGGASPHSWSLRPSDAHALEHADLVVWVGEGLESFLVQPVEALAADAYVLELSRAEGITLLRTREGGVWDEHDHDHGGDEGHEDDDHAGEHHDDHDEDDHAGEKHDDHDHASEKHDDDHDHASEKHDDDRGHSGAKHDDHAGARDDEDEHAHVHHEDGHEHDLGEFNMHPWMDPENAEVIVRAMADALVRLDPGHESVYRANEAALKSRLHVLDEELAAALDPVRDEGFIVFHDAWQYLDTHYGLRAMGSVTVNPERAPGAARLAEIRERIVDTRATCVFAEPQYEPRLVHTLVEGTGAQTGTLDPLGAALEAGPDLYFDLMRANAAAFRACFGM